jgi:putative ABC transport system ATP-binding protein
MNHPVAPNGLLLRADGLAKVYRLGGAAVHALHEASFTVAQGEYVALMGRSGSGKSTLLHLLGLLDEPSGGRYWFGGQEAGKLSRGARARLRNERIGFIFQTFNLLPRLSALENVALPLLYRGRATGPLARVQARALAALKQVGLANRAHHRPAELSGGQQQRVAIARALVMDPLLILADEPTGNLDSVTGEEIMRLLGQQAAAGRTTLVVTHDEIVARAADRVLILEDGRLMADGNGIRANAKVSGRNGADAGRHAGVEESAVEGTP